MSNHLRPRTTALTLALDAHADPEESDLTLATRTGEVVWRGQVCREAWRAGLRLRARWQGTWPDALWAMTLAVLDAELATHGLRREGDPRVDVTAVPGPGGTQLTVACRVVPCPVLAESAASAHRPQDAVHV